MHTEYGAGWPGAWGGSTGEGLLALLDDGPAYGYQLKSEFETATGGVWPLNVGQVYSTLDRLVQDGLVTAGERDGQRSWPPRHAAPRPWVRGGDAVPAERASPARDELILKVLLTASRGREHALGGAHESAQTRCLRCCNEGGSGSLHEPRSGTFGCARGGRAGWFEPKPTCAGSTSAKNASTPEDEEQS